MTAVLNSRVLVLNTSWIPIDVTTVYEAICMAVKERCRFVDPDTYACYDFEEWVVTWEDAIQHARVSMPSLSSPSVTVRIPTVVALTDYSGFATGKCRGRPKFSRRNIYLRDHNMCQYCGKKLRTDQLNLDHVVPKSQGGEMTWENIVLSCIPCNDKKKNRTPEKAGMRLISRPRAPKPGELKRPFGECLRRKLGRNIPSNWEAFVDKMYWDVGLSEKGVVRHDPSRA